MEEGPDKKNEKKFEPKVVGGKDITPEKAEPVKPEKIDPQAMLDALGKNDRYAGKKDEEPRRHDEDSETW